MKTTLPRQDFQDALGAIVTLASARTTKPILNCVRIVVDRESAELSATDGEAALRLSVPVLATDKPGEVVVPADRLLSIVREMADVELVLQADDTKATIRGAGSEFRIFTQNAADFPPIRGFDDEPDLVVDGAELLRMVQSTIYAAARETSRYAINGVMWEKQGKRLFLVATDGRRLARAGGTIIEARSGDFQAIVPAKALNIFERVFTGLGRDGGRWAVDVRMLPNQMLLRAGGRVLSTALVEGAFPRYQDVIPRDNDKKARVSRADLLSAVRRAALLTTEDSRAVKLSFTPQELIITANSPEQGDARVSVPAEFDGKTLDVGFNPVFLSDALKNYQHDTVVIELHESARPGILCGEDKNEFLYVIMPVQL